MLSIFIAFKFFIYVTMFTTCAVGLMLTGLDAAREKMNNYGMSALNNNSRYEYYLNRLTAITQKLYLPTGCLLGLSTIADAKNLSWLKDSIYKNLFTYISCCLGVLLLITIIDEVFKKAKAEKFYYKLYFIVAQEKVQQIRNMLTACARVQIQLIIFILIPIIMFILPFYAIRWSYIFYVCYFIGIFFFAFLVGIAILVTEDRILRKVFFNDLGYVLSMLAVITIIFYNNVRVAFGIML